MTDIKTIEPGKYNQLLAEALKEEPEFEKPEWVELVKTGVNKERPTADPDFWHHRSAAILRQIYLKDIVGTERLRMRFGGNKRRGSKPNEFRKAGGKIIRQILQQAEKAGRLEKSTGKKKGRQLTAKGKKYLEEVAEKAGKGNK